MNTAEQILSIVFQYRRLLPNEPCLDPCSVCFAWHAKRLAFYLNRREQIHFVLPGFPSRSQSPAKVLSHFPDLGERLALEFLQRFCDEIRAVYPPGAWITICSDGRVFVPVDGMNDQQVSDYHQGLNDIITSIGARDFALFSLDHILEGSADEIRDAFLARYAAPIVDWQTKVRAGEPITQLYRGLKRFAFEELVSLNPATSRNQLHKESKLIAYHMLQRSQAWSLLIQQIFPRSIRLSIHPQPAHSQKIGIHLLPTADAWLTPWHGVVVKRNGHVTLMKRYQAEAIGAQLVYDNQGRPNHFVCKS